MPNLTHVGPGSHPTRERHAIDPTQPCRAHEHSDSRRPVHITTLQATHSGSIQGLGSITTLNDVDLSLDGTGSLATSQLTSFTAGSISLSGGTLSLPNLIDIDNSNLSVSSGASLTLPAVTNYNSGVDVTNTLETTGSGSVLSLLPSTALTVDITSDFSWLQVEALAGAQVLMPNLTHVGPGSILLESDGASSLLNLAGLTSIQTHAGQYHITALQATHSGSIQGLGSITTLNDVDLSLDGTGSLATSQLSSFTAGSISLSGGTLSLPNLIDIDNSNLSVSSGASLTLPAVTNYNSGVDVTNTLETTGSGSVLSPPLDRPYRGHHK